MDVLQSVAIQTEVRDTTDSKLSCTAEVYTDIGYQEPELDIRFHWPWCLHVTHMPLVQLH